MATGRNQKSRDTEPELVLARQLRDVGLTDFRTQEVIELPRWAGKNQRAIPDFLFKDEQLAIFVDGCWFHGCPICPFRDSRTNAAQWRRKRAQQRSRDQRHSRALETLGWRVLRLWEHEDPAAGARAARAIIDTDPPPGTFGLG